MVSSDSYAVIITTSIFGSTSLNRSRTSRPDMPTRRTSSTATSMVLFSASAIAVGPSPASRTLYSSLNMARNDWRGLSSSSTIKRVPRGLAGEAGSPGPDMSSNGKAADIVTCLYPQTTDRWTSQDSSSNLKSWVIHSQAGDQRFELLPDVH